MSQAQQRDAGQLSVRALGPLRVMRNHQQIELGPMRRQAVLLPLALRPGQIVSRKEILDGVWGNAVPASGVALVRTYISRLRLILGTDMIVRCPAGYYLRLDSDQVDLTVFDQHVLEARELRQRAQLESSVRAWQKAFGLWRGPPLPEIPGLFAESRRQWLNDLHLSVLEKFWDTEIPLGQHTDLLAELSAAARDYPLRESLTKLLMLASNRADMRTDALAAFEPIRHHLTEVWDVSPGCPDIFGRSGSAARRAWPRFHPIGAVSGRLSPGTLFLADTIRREQMVS